MDALERNHLTPRFERWKDNPNYMKLVNECRRSASESTAVQPVFDMDAARDSLAKLQANGYYTPIGGDVDTLYEIASKVGEDIESGKLYSERSSGDHDSYREELSDTRARLSDAVQQERENSLRDYQRSRGISVQNYRLTEVNVLKAAAKIVSALDLSA